MNTTRETIYKEVLKKLSFRLPKYNKHITYLDISQATFHILNNIRVVEFRNRFNTLNKRVILSKFNQTEINAFHIVSNSIYGNTYYSGGFIDTGKKYQCETNALKFIISWRLRNIWQSNRYWNYLKEQKGIVMMTNNIEWKGGN